MSAPDYRAAALAAMRSLVECARAVEALDRRLCRELGIVPDYDLGAPGRALAARDDLARALQGIVLALDTDEAAELRDCVSMAVLDLGVVDVDDEDRPRLDRLHAVLGRVEELQRLAETREAEGVPT